MEHHQQDHGDPFYRAHDRTERHERKVPIEIIRQDSHDKQQQASRASPKMQRKVPIQQEGDKRVNELKIPVNTHPPAYSPLVQRRNSPETKQQHSSNVYRVPIQVEGRNGQWEKAEQLPSQTPSVHHAQPKPNHNGQGNGDVRQPQSPHHRGKTPQQQFTSHHHFVPSHPGQPTMNQAPSQTSSHASSPDSSQASDSHVSRSQASDSSQASRASNRQMSGSQHSQTSGSQASNSQASGQSSDSEAENSVDDRPPQVKLIDGIMESTVRLGHQVECFHGQKGDKEYLTLEELLTRNLLQLDNIDTSGNDEIRQQRKIAVQTTQGYLDKLEQKAESVY